MNVELISGSHSVGETNLHLQFTPAYRREIFKDEEVRILTRDYMLAAARKHKFIVAALGFGKDHLHVFVKNWKNFSVAKLAQLLKGSSSRMLRKFHMNLLSESLWGSKFWSAGYFYRTVGAVNSATVRKYVAESQEYDCKGSRMPRQISLVEFSA